MAERYSAQQAYLDHLRHVEGPDAEPRVPFEELSDMAIQMYETDAAIVNAQAGSQSGE